MNWKNILILALFVTVLFGCYDEDKIVPLEPGEGMVRYEFPQGENAWDQDIVEISEQFGVYLIYKDYKEGDLTVLGREAEWRVFCIMVMI